MNTAILSQVGQSAGISFAVPINAIKRILRPLIEQGRVIRADLGMARVYRTRRGPARPGPGRGRAGRAGRASGRSRSNGPATATVSHQARPRVGRPDRGDRRQAGQDV